MGLLEDMLAQSGVTPPTVGSIGGGGGGLLSAAGGDIPPRLEEPQPSQPAAPIQPTQQPKKFGEVVSDFAGNFLFSLGQAFKAQASHPGARGTMAGIGAALEGPMLYKQAQIQQEREKQDMEMQRRQMEMRAKELENSDLRLQLERNQTIIAQMKEKREAEAAAAKANAPDLGEAPEGSTVYDKKTGQPLFTVPKTEKPTQTKLTPENVTLDGKPARVFRDEYGNYFDQDKKPITGRISPYIAPPTPRAKGEITPTAESNLIQGLNKQWEAASKDVQQLYRANTIMDAGMDAARRGDLNAGSQAILVTFQKFLDPTSVVRESEYARSGAGLAMAERIRGAVEKLQKGGAGVPIQELEAFAKLGKEINTRLTAEGTSLLSAEKARITKTAERYGIPSELVVPQYNLAAPGGAAPTTPTTTASPEGWKIINVK